MYEVKVSPQVAALRQGNTGTRNAKLSTGEIVTFSRHPTYLADLPPEVDTDPHLVVDEIPKERWKRLQKSGARVTDLGAGEKSSATKEPSKEPPSGGDAGEKPAIPEDLEALAWPKLQKLGSAYGVTGKKADILKGLREVRDASSETTTPAAGEE